MIERFKNDSYHTDTQTLTISWTGEMNDREIFYGEGKDT